MIRALVLIALLFCWPAAAQNYSFSSAAITPASANTNITSAITAPNSTSAFKMQGLAGSITPTVSGNVLIIISGSIIANTGTTATHGVKFQISEGTGTAPGSNATLTGTQVGAINEYRNGFALTADTDLQAPFFAAAFVTGLTVGTAAWIDLAAESVTTASDIGFSNVNISAIEIQP
jgi:hypothetical protein